MMGIRAQRRITVSLLAAGIAVGAQAEPLRIQAAAWVDPSGKLVSGPVVVEIDGGYFKTAPAAVESGEAKAPGAVEYKDAVLCPGLIDVHAALGAWDHLTEEADAFQPDLTTRDAFDRFGPRLREALEAGITCFGLAPSDQNVIGGRIAICKTFGDDERARVIDPHGPLKLSVAPDVFQRERSPTSRSGAIGMLMSAVDGAHKARIDEDDPRDALALFANSALPGIIATPSAADVMMALDMRSRYGLKLSLIHTMDAFDVAKLVGDAKATVIVGPLPVSASERAQRAAGLLEKAGADVVIAGGLPATPANALRVGAALANRHGLSANAARRAMTSGAAQALNVADRVGSIQPGRAADLVIFSGDPLDLRSRVLAVYVDGALAYVAPQQPVE